MDDGLGGRSGAAPTEAFRCGGFTGSVVTPLRPADLVGELGRLLDPAAALKTLHWGRNYIYLAHLNTPEGPLPVAVKQFVHDSRRKRLRRRLKGTKARRSWQVARALVAAGIATPEPVLLAESERPDGPAYYVCRHLEGVFEARYLFRAINSHRAAELFPHVDVETFLEHLAHTARAFHDAGFWHRDLSSGNVLVRWPQRGEQGEPQLSLVDLNRTRVGKIPSRSERSRDLSRLMIFRPEHQERFLEAYWGRPAAELGLERHLYHLYHRAFLAKNEGKKKVRGALRRLKDLLVPRGTHGHIPDAPEGVAARDRVVWDYLSDQPHLHAGRFEKLAVRLADSGAHLTQTATLVRSLPRIRRRYRELKSELYTAAVPFDGAGVAIRPLPGRRDELLGAIEDLGARPILLRLHPWEEDHEEEEALARELAAAGYELTFALPQTRELVRDLSDGGERWTRSVEELARRFTPYGRRFQVGQAINRSKWGVWNFREYAALAGNAAEILRRHEGVELLGPAVIDFELHYTAGLVNMRRLGVHFDALASLLYVDRRGAPENRQLGFDSVDKVALVKAIAETGRNCTGRSWITEVNWPLWEGPHSPAGKSVSVSEETQADYLVRFYILALGTGMVERIFWWQLVARGYGLIDPAEERLRRRPSFAAFAHLLRRLEGALSEGPLAAAEPARLHRYRGLDGTETVVGWSTGEPVTAVLPRPARQVLGRDGETLPTPPGRRVELTPSPRYFVLEAAAESGRGREE